MIGGSDLMTLSVDNNRDLTIQPLDNYADTNVNRAIYI